MIHERNEGDIYATYEKGIYVLHIMHDYDAQNPRHWDNLGEFVMNHSRYSYGDRNYTNSNKYAEYVEGIPEDAVVLKVYMFDHSGLIFSTSPFGCPWDSGQVGLIWADRKKALDWFNETEWTDEFKERVLEILKGEIKELSLYAEGNNYGFCLHKVTDCEHCGHESEETIESCWGFLTENPVKYILEELPQEFRELFRELMT